MEMNIEPAGCGFVAWRTYIWCGPGRTSNCDWFKGNVIQPGGGASFRFDGRQEQGIVASVIIVSDQTMFKSGYLLLRPRPDGALEAEWDGGVRILCRSWMYDPKLCGA